MDESQVKEIDEQEFEQIVERMRPRLLKMGREFFNSDTEAEEIVQESWLRVWNIRNKVTLTDAYILRVARNCCVSMWRGQRAQVELTDESNIAVSEITPQEEVEERENSEWLQLRLQRLPQAEREVWQLFYDEGLTVEEIAERRATTVPTVRKTLSNVRHRLRTDLRRHFINLRKFLIIILIAFATGIAVAAIIRPSNRIRDIMERVLHLPEDTTIYEIPEVVATYHLDIDALFRHIAAELHYPEGAMTDSIEGRVIVRFVVEKDGRLTHFEVLKTPDERLSAEAIRVMRLTEPWVPAQKNGRPVRSYFCIPICFRIK